MTRNKNHWDAKAVDRFLHWIEERWTVAVKRAEDMPAPWTTDKVIQTQFFTNPWREMDKTTVWFRDNIRGPLAEDDDVLFATLLFRWFNSIPTGEFLLEAHKGRDPLYWFRPTWTAVRNNDGKRNRQQEFERLVTARQDEGHKLFGGAYIIKLANGVKKHLAVIRNMAWLWRTQGVDLLECCRNCPTMQELHARLVKIPYLGPFMAYEVICDLQYTWVCRNAPDIRTWANAGPGAYRGLRRLLGLPVNKRGDKGLQEVSPNGRKVKDQDIACQLMQELLAIAEERIDWQKPLTVWEPINDPARTGWWQETNEHHMPTFDMRTIEHSLCEFDKYERARTGVGGKMKRKFTKGTS